MPMELLPAERLDAMGGQGASWVDVEREVVMLCVSALDGL